VAGAAGSGWTSLPVELVVGPEPRATLEEMPLTLRVDGAVLRPMLSLTEVDETAPGVDIPLGSVAVHVDTEGFHVDANVSATVPLCMIAESGVLVEATGVRPLLGFAADLPAGVEPGFRGVHIGEARVHLPEGLPEFAAADLMMTVIAQVCPTR